MRFSLTFLGLVLSVAVGCASNSDSKRVEELVNDLHNRLDRLAEKVATIAEPGEPVGLDISSLPKNTTSDLVFILGTRNQEERTRLIQRRLDAANSIETPHIDNIGDIVGQVEALNVILTGGEDIDLAQLQEVQAARDRLLDLLHREIPSLVTNLDKQALKADDFTASKQLWVTSSAILGMYPGSTDPTEVASIQRMVTDHESVGSRIDLVRRQQYNLWACKQIRHAWKDFQEQTDDESRVKTCLHFLGPIHPGLLEPAALELYRDFLQTIRSKLSDESDQDLAENLSVANRKLLAEL